MSPVFVGDPGEAVSVDIVLRPGSTGSIEGLVSLNGEPIRGRIHWKGATKEGNAWVQDGHYRADGVETGKVEVAAYRKDPLHPEEVATLWISAGETSVKNFLWHEERLPIHGRVVSEGGQPLPDIAVCAFLPEKGPLLGLRGSTRTDENGDYVLDLPSRAIYDITAENGPAHATHPDIVPPADGINFVVPELGRLRLQFIDAATGEPVHRIERLESILSWRRSGPGAYSWVDCPSIVDARGYVDLDLPLGTGDLHVCAQVSGFAPVEVKGISVTSDPHQTLRVLLSRGTQLTLRFRPEGETHRISGHVLFLVRPEHAGLISGPYPTQEYPVNDNFGGLHLVVGNDAATFAEIHQRYVSFPSSKSLQRGLTPGPHVLVVFPDDLELEPSQIQVPESGELVVEVKWRVRR
ncbi:MAG: carboxypeptidase-like regulatory domain-containing protein [Planctomycetota bacterium]